MNTNFQKYLKYKSKYLDLKNELQLQVGGSRSLYGGAGEDVVIRDYYDKNKSAVYDIINTSNIAAEVLNTLKTTGDGNGNVIPGSDKGYDDDDIGAEFDNAIFRDLKEKIASENSLKQELNNIKVQIQSLEGEKTTADGTIASLRKEVIQLTQQLNDTIKLLQTANTNEIKCNADLTQIQQELADCQIKLAAAETAAVSATAAASTAAATSSPKAAAAAVKATRLLQDEITKIKQELSDCTVKLAAAVKSSTPPAGLGSGSGSGSGAGLLAKPASSPGTVSATLLKPQVDLVNPKTPPTGSPSGSPSGSLTGSQYSAEEINTKYNNDFAGKSTNDQFNFVSYIASNPSISTTDDIIFLTNIIPTAIIKLNMMTMIKAYLETIHTVAVVNPTLSTFATRLKQITKSNYKQFLVNHFTATYITATYKVNNHKPNYITI